MTKVETFLDVSRYNHAKHVIALSPLSHWAIELIFQYIVPDILIVYSLLVFIVTLTKSLTMHITSCGAHFNA